MKQSYYNHTTWNTLPKSKVHDEKERVINLTERERVIILTLSHTIKGIKETIFIILNYFKIHDIYK